MIDCKCRCGYEFSVPQELSGSSLQCPECHRLVDIPLLSELDHINADGTVKVESLALKSEPERITELQRIYRPSRRDTGGHELDLRATDEEIRKAGVEEIPRGVMDGLIPGAPKYDPETGELMLPLDVKGDAKGPRPAIPVGSSTLNYARGATTPPPGFLQTLSVFFSGASLAVLFSVLLIHVLCIGTWVLVGMGLIFAGLFQVVFYGMLFAHYAIVVEDSGPGERDELPVPLRGLSFSEDIWHPSVNFHGSLFLSYLLLLLSIPLRNIPISLSMLVLGTVIFPVIFLICCTSGMLSDLRPDRILGTLACCGWRYWFAVPLWAVAAVVYGWGIIRTASMGLSVGPFGEKVAGPHNIAVDMPVLCAGIVLMHLFSIYLGNLYRRFHADFPWAIRHTHLPAERARSRRKRYGQLFPDGAPRLAPPPSATPASSPAVQSASPSTASPTTGGAGGN